MEKKVNDMVFFNDYTEDIDAFRDFRKKQFDDDQKVKDYFDKVEHKKFISSLLKLGTLIDTIAIYFDFIKPQVYESIKNPSLQSRNRKMNKFIKDLNAKINLEYGFNEDTIIVEEAILFEDEIYLFFNKAHFLKTIDSLEM